MPKIRVSFRDRLMADCPHGRYLRIWQKVSTMIIMPMSALDFDPTEAAIAWRRLTDSGHQVVFATPDGRPALPDPRMLTGEGLGVWKRLLMARADAVSACGEMLTTSAFRRPLAYAELRENNFDGLSLHGGHAPGMRAYLESEELRKFTAAFAATGKPVGAICHGVLLLARSARPDGRSTLFGRKCTCLLRGQELAAHSITRLWLGDYYRTYPGTTTQDEVISFLAKREDFLSGPPALFRDAPSKLGRGFSVRDGNIITARWPGDAYNYAAGFLAMLAENKK